MLTPSIASAQDISLYEKQKVAIASIIDKNDRHINSKLKEYILNGIRDAFVNSNDYEVFNVNIDDIRNKLKAKNLPPSFSNICKEVGQIAEFIIFTEISVTSSSFGNAGSQNTEIIITSSQYRIATGSQVAMNAVTTQPNVQSIQSSTAQLMSKLFGVKMAGYSNSQSSYNNSQSSSSSRNAYNNSSSYSSQSSYGQSSSYQRPSYQQQSPSYQSQSNYGSSSSSSYSRSTQSTSSQSYTQNAEDRYLNLAREGNKEAQYKLGGCYEFGIQGVSKQYQNAFYWYKRAAEQGHTNAQYRLGFCYEYGIGVANNFDYAVSWYRKAARNGSKEAETRLRQIYKY